MKKAGILFMLLLAAVFLCSGCGIFGSGPENAPYDPGTPEPPDHEGLFISDHGTMLFSGDGESVTIDFDAKLAELTGLPEGKSEATYVFRSGNLPPFGSYPVRYDTAYELEITVGDQSAVIGLGNASADGKSSTASLNMVTETSIPMLFSENDFRFTITFIKEVNE